MGASQALTGLLPVIAPGARLLILGSMPGAASLARGEYYAHPRNAFWDLIEHRLGIPRATPYPQRLDALTRHGIALWDVAAHCRRRGSLDSAIEHATVVPNDFADLFQNYPTITTVCFNGQKAAALYRKLVLPSAYVSARLVYHTLPSTSPANATLTAVEKLRYWSVVNDQTGLT
jgi:TDG/mug DNA glycosylase family protein